MLFSVIMPLYNKAAYVTKAIDSVLAQTHADYEFIVVNDGSTDNSLLFVERMLQEDNRLQQLNNTGRFLLVNQKNTGVSTARNNAVAQSRGEFVCFLDADDWWNADFLKEMDVLIRNYPDAGMYGCNYWYVKNTHQRICVKQIDTGYMDYIQTYLTQMEQGGGMPLTSISVAIKRTVFEKMGGFKPHLKLGEDFDLWLRISLKHKAAFLNKSLAYYNQNAEGQGRATKQLQKPEAHEVFNYDCFSEEEKRNPNLKLLLDKKRASGLFPYYLSKPYRDLAQRELAKVDWSNLPKSALQRYKTPIWILKCKQRFMQYGSCVKQRFIKMVK